MAEALMKQLTGGDSMKARRMRQDFFSIAPTWKLWLAANHKPNIRGTDLAVWRRIKLIPFVVTIPEAEKDKTLSAKLKAEWPGILNWAVEGCLAWQRGGLAEPDEVRQATDAYRAEQDLIGGFLEEVCFVNADVRVQASALHGAYQTWSGDKVTTQKAFTQRLEAKGFASKAGSGNIKYYHGLGLPATGTIGD